MNHIPQTLYRVARSWIQSLCGFNRATTSQNANQEPPHPPNNDINEITMLESMDDVHLFLEELRLSAMTRPNLNISNLTRYEFITNLLITEVRYSIACIAMYSFCFISILFFVLSCPDDTLLTLLYQQFPTESGSNYMS